MSDVLKPCPFCGTQPEIGSLGGDNENWCIWCPSCIQATVETDVYRGIETKEKCIDLWNTRHQDEALRKSHAELVEALSDLKDASKSSGYPHEAIKRAEQALSEAQEIGTIDDDREQSSLGKECKEIINENITSLYTTY